ncbi:hypothetical protein D3C87_1702210 [compost metagenome]
MFGGGIDGTAGADLVAGDRGDVDDVAALLLLHVRKCSTDAVEHALEVDVDGAVPILDLAALQWRVRHQPGIVEHDVDAAMEPDGVIDQALDLLERRYVGLNGSLLAER